jgi:ABC-type oligopeptide transport system substrate-binding subunit
MPSSNRLACLLLVGLLSSCTVHIGPQPTPRPTASPTPPAAISLRLLEADDVQTLDPALIDDPISLAVGRELFEGLTRLDAQLRPAPGLASSWEITDAGRTYTFHLRSATYQSGAHVQAQDAVTDWRRALDPKTASPLAAFLAPLGARHAGEPLTGVDVVDPQTLRVHLAAANSELLTLLSLPPFWLYDPSAVAAHFGDQVISAGSGPYVLDRWDRGRSLSLHSWSGSWQAARQVRSVSIEIVPDPATRLQRFQDGGTDIVHGLTGAQLLGWASDPARLAELDKVPTGRTVWLGFNTVAGQIYGPVSRQALAQAIDRGRLTDLALFGSMLGVPATDLLPPGIPGHVDRSLPAYDPATTRRALDAAAFPDPIDLYFSGGQTTGRVARDLQDQLASATGRTVTLHPMGDFSSQASRDRLPFFIDAWTTDVPHPADLLENVLRSDAQFNNLQVQDKRMVAALDEGLAAVTFDDGIRGYQTADGIAIDDVRVIPLYSGVEPYLVRSGLQVPFMGSVLPYRWEDIHQQ